jgi:hypothetical protein
MSAGPRFFLLERKKWGKLGHFRETLENFGHFQSKMVDFGLLTCLENHLFVKIILVGRYHKKELVELNNIGTSFVFCSTLGHFGPFAAFPPHKQACAKQYNHTKEK